MARNYEHLEAWQKSIDFAVFIYSVSKNFPKEEQYGLTSQIRRATVSISSNIAEGAGRSSKKDFLRFIFMALGSLNEVESQIHIAHRLGYLDKNELFTTQKQIIELGNLLGGLRNYLKK